MVEWLRHEIISGRVRPGQWLRQEDLAARFETSTMPVREALRALQAEGLVTVYPHRGAVVTALTADEILEVYEIRATLEAMAAELGVPGLDSSQLEELSRCVDVMEQAEIDVVALIDANRRFHSIIYEASGRKRLCDLIVTLRNSTQHYLHTFVTLLGRMPDANAEHRQILGACRARDGKLASEVLRRHHAQVGHDLSEYVRKYG